MLVDTHLLVWAGQNDGRLSAQARAALADPANVLWFSSISVAEVAIKFALGRPDFRIDPNDFRRLLLANGYRELMLEGEHACRLADLPPLHRDPFDRLLIAQSLATGMPLLTADAALGAYGASVRVVD